VSRLLRFLAAGYGKKSWIALGLLITVGGIVGYRWSDLLDANGTMDWFLAGTWIFMALLLTWDVNARRDIVLLMVGFVGGAVIEWWGTNTLLWTYFTNERPPLWILPAWPIAALAIDRLWRILDRAIDELDGTRGRERSFRIAYWIAIPTFVVSMLFFARHTWSIPATQIVGVGMILLAIRLKHPRRDFLVFGAGSFLGIFLEYWGTSRMCWTYYTEEVPPLVAIVAHGFAAIAFARGADLVERALSALRDLARRQPIPE
jgi:hypothetical protein